MAKPTDRELQEFTIGDCLHSIACTQKALDMVVEMGSVEKAHAYTEQRVAIAFKRGWRSSLYQWAGVALAFRKATRVRGS